MKKVAAVVLAAGRSSRFEGARTKLIAEFCKRPLVRQVVEAATASLAHPVVVVTGHAREEIEMALDGSNVVLVHNSSYRCGLASSLRTGLALLKEDIQGAVICLADMPKVTAETIDLLIRSFDRTDQAEAIAPVCNGQRGNPVLISCALFSRVEMLSGDTGAKHLLDRSDTIVLEEQVEDVGVLIDIDTKEALDALSDPTQIRT